MTTRQEPALRTGYRFALSSGEQVFAVATLRRSEFVLRYTTSRDVIADEGLIARSFPRVTEPSRLVAVVVVGGLIELDEGGRLGPGDAILVAPSALGRSRSRDACHLDLEWGVEEGRAPPITPRRLERPPMEQVTRIGDALLDRRSDQRPLLASAFELFRSIGAPITLSVDALDGEPSDRDRRLARAMEAQVENLTSAVATKFDMGESIGLSERQINRIVSDFHARYHVNAASYRDARNRWRIQNAALLLSRPTLTVAEVAREVGYASANALARAFAKTGFPPPAVLRERLAQTRKEMSERDPSI